MLSNVFLEVPEVWLEPENIIIGYYQHRLDCYVLIFIDQQRAIAIEKGNIKTVDWQSPDYLIPPKSIEQLKVESFV